MRKHSALLRFDEDEESEVQNWKSPKGAPADRTDASENEGIGGRIAGSTFKAEPNTQVSFRVTDSSSDESVNGLRLPTILVEPMPIAPLLGESTANGGLFFLLHVLRHLGIPALVRRYPILAEADFARYILRSLVDRARAPEDDPIRMALPPSDMKFHLPEELCLDSEFIRAAAPAGLQWRVVSSGGSDALLRIWTLAVRRWCWRKANLTLAEIVCRRGKVWLTRTDLDVTFPLSVVDVRIRRIGLDIDPGWVPWLGGLGKVVRFHYRESDGAWGTRSTP